MNGLAESPAASHVYPDPDSGGARLARRGATPQKFSC